MNKSRESQYFIDFHFLVFTWSGQQSALLSPISLLLVVLLLVLLFLLHLRKANVRDPSNFYNSHLEEVEEDEEEDEDGRAATVEGDQVGAQEGRQETGGVEEEATSQGEQGDDDEDHVLVDSKPFGNCPKLFVYIW